MGHTIYIYTKYAHSQILHACLSYFLLLETLNWTYFSICGFPFFLFPEDKLRFSAEG